MITNKRRRAEANVGGAEGLEGLGMGGEWGGVG